MSKKLHDLQKTFFNNLNSTKEDSVEISSEVTGHFQVYQEAYRLRLREAITEDFSQSLKAAGRALTDELFNDFFSQSFSDSFTLSAIGFVWLDFLNRTKIMLPKWFIELSHFEWELTLTLYRESDSEFKPREVILVEPQELGANPVPKVVLAPAVKILEYQFPVSQIYAGHSEKTEKTKTKIAVWRDNDESHFAELNELSLEILERFMQGQTLSQITHELSPQNEETLASQIQNAFAELSEHGIIAIV